MKPKNIHLQHRLQQTGLHLIATATLCMPAARAAEANWTALTSTDWNDTTNWSITPTVADNLNVNWYGGPPGLGAPVISAAETLQHGNDIKIGLFGGTGRIDHLSGSSTCNTLSLGWAGGTGTYNLADTTSTGGPLTGFGTGSGSLTVTNRIAMGHLFWGSDGGAATFNINTSGTLAVANNFEIAVGDKGADNGLCIVNLDAGTVTAGNLVLAQYDDAAAGRPGVPIGVFNQGGGTVTLTHRLTLAQGSQNSSHATGNGGTYTLTNGTLRTDNAHDNFWEAGVSMASANWNYVNGSGSGTRGGTATFNLDGGTLSTLDVFSDDVVDNNGTPDIPGDDVTYTRGTSTFNFNGGNLQAQANRDVPWFQFITGLTRANVRDGGAIIDSNGFNLYTSQPLLHSDISGDAAIDGGLTKNGGGQLEITADCTFTGPVVVNGGTLYVTPGNAPTNNAFSYVSGITINSGGTLKATGNALFGWDGSQAKPITIHSGGTAIAAYEDQNVGLVTLNGGTLASQEATGVWGSWNFGRATARELLVTEDSIVSAQGVGFVNGAFITVDPGKTLTFSGSIIDKPDAVSSVSKYGDGTLVLSGPNTYSGSTSVYAGRLVMNAPTLGDASTLSLFHDWGAVLELNHSGTDVVDTFVYDGIQLDAGVYRSVEGSGEGTILAGLTGTGKIQVTSGPPGTGYGDWAAANLNNQTADQDFNGDGVANGIAYFMGNPGNILLPGIVGSSITWNNGGNIPETEYGTQFVVQTSPDLVSWTDIGAGDSHLINTAGAVTFTLPTGMGRLFVRLVVTPN